MDYRHCSQTVTVYRHTRQGVIRRVVPGCYFRQWESQVRQPYGPAGLRHCLLIVPGPEQPVLPGDRVYAGIGPEEIRWTEFVPEQVEGLSQLTYVKPWYWQGRLCHTEAGNP